MNEAQTRFNKIAPKLRDASCISRRRPRDRKSKPALSAKTVQECQEVTIKQNRTMKIVTYAMMIMIIVMGFSLASAMGVYWFIGAIISIIQTLVTQAIIARQSKEKK